MAARAAGPDEADRPVRPGQSGGSFQPLTEPDMQRIFFSALELLENTGMADAVPEFVEVVTEAWWSHR